MTTQQTEPNSDPHVGVRPRADVEEAHRALAAVVAGTDEQSPLTRGALTGYLWALGREDVAPITGAGCAGAPDLSLLTAETDAAAVRLEDAARRTVPRRYTEGVYEALAWVCGHSDKRP
jgi:hypothetical protein